MDHGRSDGHDHGAHAHGAHEHAAHEHAAHDHDHPAHDHDDPAAMYAAALEAHRQTKDEVFRHSQQSPIPHDYRHDFAGLSYYPPDLRFRLEGLRRRPYEGEEPVRFAIPTSDGRLRPAERAGVLDFELDGQALRLTGYRFEGDEDDDSLFVPFMDATSGVETYGAGRYLELEPEDDGSYTLDFNLAYNPFCVYDPRFSCPITPPENRLPVRIEAGERMPEALASSSG